VEEIEDEIVDPVDAEEPDTEVKEKPARKPRKRKEQAAASPGWKRWLNYQSVVRQIPFFLFLTLLAVVYIYNGHYADKTIRQIGKTSREVRELQYEYKTVKGAVMSFSKQSSIANAIEPYGLKELSQPPVILPAEKKE